MFRAATGRSILEEIQGTRLNEVKRLLANPLVKIGAIAAQTGYRSENFLTRLFRRETGMTPSQWRKSQQASAQDLPKANCGKPKPNPATSKSQSPTTAQPIQRQSNTTCLTLSQFKA
jgi:AraC-like DNA-binding protein